MNEDGEDITICAKNGNGVSCTFIPIAGEIIGDVTVQWFEICHQECFKLEISYIDFLT